MPTSFICLANSFKEGGRCLAGIELDNNHNPILISGRPKWIRPICDTHHGEVPTEIAHSFRIMDIIELEITGSPAKTYQSENILFNAGSIKTIGNYTSSLTDLCENRNLIFGNRGKALSKDYIGNLNYSLLFISVTTFEVSQKSYEVRNSRPQVRLVFTYNGNQYDFPVTDPVFLYNFQQNPEILDNVDRLFLTLSISVEFENWYYKLVGGIIYES